MSLNDALKDAGDNWLMIGDEPWNKVKQRAYAREKIRKQFIEQSAETPDDLRQFSMNGTSQQLRAQMLDDKFVLKDIAIVGQHTVLYAPPNSGKTLLTIHGLVESIKAGEINANDVIYINADDTYKGLITKLEIAEQHGFNMLSPGHNGFQAADLLPQVQSMIDTDTAKGIILILDTLKKFTDLMDKKIGSKFGVLIREFVQKGGTVISLAHANKHTNSEGKNVHAGTTDIKDDCDCVFIFNILNDIGGTKTVELQNDKSRGDVAKTVVYEYTTKHGAEYMEIFDSVRRVDSAQVPGIKRNHFKAQSAVENHDVIESIKSILKDGAVLKTEIIKQVAVATPASKPKVQKVLETHTGFMEHEYWWMTIGEKNAHSYALNQYLVQN